MELNWSTFVLEIINFLILVWILKRFLYRPVLEVIERRRAAVEKTLADAGTLHDEAVGLQKQYEGRLADWEQERRKARASLADELEDERTRQLKELRHDLLAEREKARVIEARQQADIRHDMEQTALAQGARFAARLLQQAAGPELEARLIELAIGAIAGLPEESRAALRNSYGKESVSIEVSSAWPLPDATRERLARELATLTGTDIPLHFAEDRTLVAGIRIGIGAWTLGLNIHDELRGFGKLSRDE